MIMQILWLVVAVLVAGAVLVLALPPLRRAVLSRAIFKTYKSILPQMSDTERDALEAGTVWWEGDLFQGKRGLGQAARVPGAQAHRGRAVLHGQRGRKGLCARR